MERKNNPSFSENTDLDAQSQAVASGNAYDVIKKRLTEQGKRLDDLTQALNEQRLAEFGGSQMQVIARTRIRTEHNCVARDMVQVGEYLLFGYNVFMGLKKETHVSDVLSLYRLTTDGPSDANNANNAINGNASNVDDVKSDTTQADNHTLEAVDLAGSFLDQANFVQDFHELYRYYKNTQLTQLIVKDGKLLIAFQIGERVSDIRVFRFGISSDGRQVDYIDNRGERDIEPPPPHDFDWILTTREQMVNGKHPHMNILDTVFVETVAGKLTIKIENNTESGRGIYSEPVNDQTQSLTDAQIYYAKVGNLILLKILPYREEQFRHLVYNTLTETVLRLDAIGQSCVQLPEDHGIVFPGGYYLQTGEHKLFGTDDKAKALRFKRKIISPNGEDVLYLFYDVVSGVMGLFGYNLIKKQLANPIYCNGYALAEDGLLVLFNDQPEPSRIHPMQIWQTPYASSDYVSQLPESRSFYGKIGNKELVRGISDLYGVTRLIGNQSVSQKLYEELVNTTSKLFDDYYWLAEPQLDELAQSIRTIMDTSELVIDEFIKVQSIQKQTQLALDQAQQAVDERIRQIKMTTFESIDDHIKQLSALRQQQGRLAGLETLRYLDDDKLTQLQAQISQAEEQLARQTVTFLSGDDAKASYEATLADIEQRLQTAKTKAELMPVLDSINDTASGLDLLTELLGTLDIADATLRTQIIDDISAIYARLNQTKAKLNHASKHFGSAEAVAQFSAQFKLFSQSITNALSTATTPEKSDEQLARLLVQLEELESQFSEYDEFLNDIISKREEVFDAFENHKQQLLDAQNRKAQNLEDGAKRMLESIKKRTQSNAGTGFSDEDALNTYFVSDGLVQKVRQVSEQLRQMGFSVKADDIDAHLKAIQTDSFKSLKDKADLFEDGGQIIKLGKHRFSVNTQPLDLTLLTRTAANGEQVMNLHLTGTDYYQRVDDARLNALQPFWQMTVASESTDVYRAEYLAYSIIDSAKKGLDNLSERKLYDALHQSQTAHHQSASQSAYRADGALAKLVRDYATSRYQMGYEKGIHDHDATLILQHILPVLQDADLLIYTPNVRTLAQLFYRQLMLASHMTTPNTLTNTTPTTLTNTTPNTITSHKLPSQSFADWHADWHGSWLSQTQLAQTHTWADRAITARQLQQILGSDTAKSLLVAEMMPLMAQFIASCHGHDKDSSVNTHTVFNQQLVQPACQYLVEQMGQVDRVEQPIIWQTSGQAQQLYQHLLEQLQRSVDGSLAQLYTATAKLITTPKSAYELLATWFEAIIRQKAHQNTPHDINHDIRHDLTTDEPTDDKQTNHDEHQHTHYLPEAVAIFLTQLSPEQRQTLQTSPTHQALQAFNQQPSFNPHPSAMQQAILDDMAQLPDFKRSVSGLDLQVTVTGMLGNHRRINTHGAHGTHGKGQQLSLVVDVFMNRLYQHQHHIIPAYQEYLQLRTKILHDSRAALRLDEFQPRPLSSFVRNQLINQSYLPLIGDNLAKQMGTVGDDKRTDLMGLLMMISPPGYGKTTLMEYVANRLGLIFMKINCPSIGHDVTSLDPAQAPNATAREELNKINLAFEMGNNVMLYLDDIQHTHAEFLQKFISLCDGTRRIDGVWQGKTKTYDMRGKKFCVVMAGNPYTESGDLFKVPDMLANRADIYNLGDILGGMQDAFALSYLENALTSHPVLSVLVNRNMNDVYHLIDRAYGKPPTQELSYPYAGSEIAEMVAILRHMMRIQSVILKVNQTYIASASQEDKYRTEPAFKLQGSYRNMNKMTEKLSAVMNDAEIEQLIDDHYLGESQLLTQGAESNLLKLNELRGRLSEPQQQRWQQIKADFLRNKALGGDDSDTGNKIVLQLMDLVSGFAQINDSVHQTGERLLQNQQATQKAQQKNQQIRHSQQDQLSEQLTQQLTQQLSHSIMTGFEQVSSQLSDARQAITHWQQQTWQQKTTQSEHKQGKDEQSNGEQGKDGQGKHEQEHDMTQLVQAVDKLGTSQTPQGEMLLQKTLEALQGLLLRLDEKLRLDASTDNSGKQIAMNLARLNQIINDLE